MNKINETWQAAVDERGDRAFELFMIYHHGYGQKDSSSNEQVEAVLKQSPTRDFRDILKLKPIAELVRSDIERYGEWAFLMYEFEDFGQDHKTVLNFKSNQAFTDLIEDNDCQFKIKRKLYANVPFNLEWAMAGVPIEFLNPCNNQWELVVKKGVMDEDAVNVFFTECPAGMWIEPIDLRHPFPPVKELGL